MAKELEHEEMVKRQEEEEKAQVFHILILTFVPSEGGPGGVGFGTNDLSAEQ